MSFYMRWMHCRNDTENAALSRLNHGFDFGWEHQALGKCPKYGNPCGFNISRVEGALVWSQRTCSSSLQIVPRPLIFTD
jgi:hypothetical protein